LLTYEVVDLGAWIYPKIGTSHLACFLVGLSASATRVVTLVLVEWLMGMQWELIVQHAVIATAMGMGFGGMGAAMVPTISMNLHIIGKPNLSIND